MTEQFKLSGIYAFANTPSTGDFCRVVSIAGEDKNFPIISQSLQTKVLYQCSVEGVNKIGDGALDLDYEYSVAIETNRAILVSNDGKNWVVRHFAAFPEGRVVPCGPVYAWSDGRTGVTCVPLNLRPVLWNYYRPFTKGEEEQYYEDLYAKLETWTNGK